MDGGVLEAALSVLEHAPTHTPRGGNISAAQEAASALIVGTAEASSRPSSAQPLGSPSRSFLGAQTMQTVTKGSLFVSSLCAQTEIVSCRRLLLVDRDAAAALLRQRRNAAHVSTAGLLALNTRQQRHPAAVQPPALRGAGLPISD